MRTYTETHPHITFRLDLKKASYKLWMLLGEACSKAEYLVGMPLLPAVEDSLFQLYLEKGVLATTAIEGNSLTEAQVRQLREGTLKLPPSKEYLGQEIENILTVCNAVSDHILSGKRIEILFDDIMRYNALILKDLPLEEGVVPGKIRTYDVGVGSYRGAPPKECEHLLQKLCTFLNDDFVSEDLSPTAVGILKAIVAHIYIAWIHPFGDGNGRTARILEFQIMLSVGIPSTAAHLLSNHYNLTRSQYYRYLDMSHKSGGNILPFIEYTLQGFIDGLNEQISAVKWQQIIVHWRDYVQERFRDKDSLTDRRRRWLVIDLTNRGKPDPVPFSEVRHVSPRIAEAYADKTDKTVKRDLDELQAMGLVTRTPKGYRDHIERMAAFIPPQRIEEQFIHSNGMSRQLELGLEPNRKSETA